MSSCFTYQYFAENYESVMEVPDTPIYGKYVDRRMFAPKTTLSFVYPGSPSYQHLGHNFTVITDIKIRSTDPTIIIPG